MKDLSPAELQELKDLVRRDRVYYEVHVERNAAGGPGPIVEVGFRVELLGTHERGRATQPPGCARCQQVWLELRRLALAALPDPGGDGGGFRYDLEPFDHAFHSSSRSDRDDILLAIAVAHPQGLGPIDEGERRGLARLIANLRELGIHEHAWQETAAAPAPPASPA